MNISNIKFNNLVIILSNFILLNFIWLIMCIPVITIFPATTAMFGVARTWKIKRDYCTLKPFFSLFKDNFKQSFFAGNLWLLIGILLMIDFNLIHQLPIKYQTPLLLLTIFIGFLYIITSIFLIPIIVHFNPKNWINLVKNSLLLSISHFHITLVCLSIILIMIIVMIRLPFTVFILGSLTAYLIFSLCNVPFKKVEHINSDKS